MDSLTSCQNITDAGPSNEDPPKSKRQRNKNSSPAKQLRPLKPATVTSLNSPATFQKLFGKFTSSTSTRSATQRGRFPTKPTEDDDDVQFVEMPSIDIVDLDDSMDIPEPSILAKCSKTEETVTSVTADNSVDANESTAAVETDTIERIDTSTHEISDEDVYSSVVKANTIDNSTPEAQQILDSNNIDEPKNTTESEGQDNLTEPYQNSETLSDIQELAANLNVCLKDLPEISMEEGDDTLKESEIDQTDGNTDVVSTKLAVSEDPQCTAPSPMELIKTALQSNCTDEKNIQRLSYAGVDKSGEAVTALETKSIEEPSNALLFYSDNEGSFNSHHSATVPMYDTISDDSFICDKTLTPKSSKPSKSIVKIDAMIDLTDTPTYEKESPSHRTPKKRITVSEDLDDSVVFVSETLNASPPSLNFISIASGVKHKVPKNLKRLKHKVDAKQHRVQSNPHSQPQRSRPPISFVPVPAVKPVYTSNSYNPSKLDTTKTTKRMVIIDGSNIAYAHSNNTVFSVRGIEICIEFFERNGHVVKAVVPQMRLKQRMSSDSELLEKLHKAGKLVITPCKNLPGKNSISYDDRFILDLAVEFDAAIISNDNYRDILFENPTKYRAVIETRVVGYTWCIDMIILAKDPYGRNGPSLEEILNRVVPPT